MSATDRFDAGLLKALGHPLRLRLIELISEVGEASPVALAREFNQPLATVSHHVRLLRDLGFLELTRTEPRRGAVEHFYRVVALPFIDDAQWEQLPLAMRRGLARQTFRKIFAEASGAGADGGFDDPGSHVDRIALELDDVGRRELSDALIALLRQADEIQRRVDLRRLSTDGSDGALRPSRLVILHYGVRRSPAATTQATERQRQPAQRPPLP